MPALSRRFWCLALIYLCLMLGLGALGRQVSSTPVNDSAAEVRSRADQLLQRVGWMPQTPSRTFKVWWLTDSLVYRAPACSTPSWVLAADAQVNLGQYFTTAMGHGYALTYVYYGTQREPPVSLVRWLQRYVRQVGARMGWIEQPLSAYLLVAHPKDCAPLPNMQTIFH